MNTRVECLDELILACTEGSQEKVQSFIEKGYDVNRIQRLPGSCYQTPLLEACRFNHPHLLEFLLKQETCGKRSWFTKLVDLPHRYGADLTKIYSRAGSLMHVVARYGCHHVAEWLIELGGDIDIVYRNQSALQIAVSMKNTKIAKRLMQANACPNDQLKVLGLAVIRGNKDIVRMLLDSGVFYRLHSESVNIKTLLSTNWLIMGNEGMTNLLDGAKTKVLSLQHICRIVTRDSIGTCSQYRVDLLPIPTVHKDYLRLKELDDIT